MLCGWSLEFRKRLQNNNSMTYADKLLSLGWREFPDQFRPHDRAFYKRFDTATRCKCNDDKPGIQVCIHVCGPIPQLENDIERIEMDLSGELPDGQWIKLFHWAMPLDLDECLANIPRLLATWEFMAAYKKEKPALTLDESSPFWCVRFETVDCGYHPVWYKADPGETLTKSEVEKLANNYIKDKPFFLARIDDIYIPKE